MSNLADIFSGGSVSVGISNGCGQSNLPVDPRWIQYEQSQLNTLKMVEPWMDEGDRKAVDHDIDQLQQQLDKDIYTDMNAQQNGSWFNGPGGGFPGAGGDFPGAGSGFPGAGSGFPGMGDGGFPGTGYGGLPGTGYGGLPGTGCGPAFDEQSIQKSAQLDTLKMLWPWTDDGDSTAIQNMIAQLK